MCRKSQKLTSCQKTSETVSNVAQSRTVPSAKIVTPVYNSTDIQGVAPLPDSLECANYEFGRMDCGSTDDVKMNGDLESVKVKIDGSSMSIYGVNSLPVTASVTPSRVDVSSSEGTSLEGSSAEKVDRLRQTIDRATGQLYTIVEVYLMMMKPSRVPLEYDWIDTSVNSGVAADDMSGKLRKLVSIAKAAFTASTAKPRVNLSINDRNCNK